MTTKRQQWRQNILDELRDLGSGFTTGDLAVWAASRKVGLLGLSDRREYVFTYDLDAESPIAQVPLTMPVRLESWSSRDLHPIFQMNLPSHWKNCCRTQTRRSCFMS